jgi:serine/threonine-protein kinase
MGMSDLWKHQQKLDKKEDPIDPPGKTPVDDMIGREIADKYIVESELGKGGMGVLYLARHKTLNNSFVVKLIRAFHIRKRDEVIYRRFKREARAIAAVRHRNVVHVVDYDIIDASRPYIVMEYVEGENLSTFLKNYKQGLPYDLFFLFMKQLCRAASAIHQAEIVHRDLKPSNIMVTGSEGEYELKVLDFGLSFVQTPAHETSQERLTTPGERLGTPYYMAPEQCLTQPVDARTDIYALGLIAYKLLTGRGAFRGDDVIEVIRKQVKSPPPDISELRPDAPLELQAAILKAIQKRPQDRYASSDDFLDALRDASIAIPNISPVASGRFAAGTPQVPAEIRRSPSTERPWLLVTLIILLLMSLSMLAWQSCSQQGRSLSELPKPNQEAAHISQTHSSQPELNERGTFSQKITLLE